jgi:hypothetical protein
MPKPIAPQPLARVLSADAALAAWTARRDREEKVLRSVRRALPRPVAERVFVADAGGPMLLLSTAAGAIAAVVRQRSSEILSGLGREGWQFSGIRVKVQPRSEPPPTPKRDLPQWDSTSRRPVAALAATLPRGALRAALERLLRRAG